MSPRTRLVLPVCLALGVSSSAVAGAQEVLSYRIAFFGNAEIYSDPQSAPTALSSSQLSYPELVENVEAMFEEDVRFEIIPNEALRRAARGDGEVEPEWADYRRDVGIEHFANYDLTSAISVFEQAIELYHATGASMTRPREIATAYEFLARAQIELASQGTTPDQNLLAAARRSFKALIRLHPNANIRPGIFPDEVVGRFEEAYAELLYDDGRELAIETPQASELADRHRLDYLVHSYFIREPADTGGTRMVLHLVDASGQMVERHIVPLTDETLSSWARVSRAVSQVVACVPLRRTEPPVTRGDAGRTFFQAGWGVVLYGDRPTGGQFLNQGIALLVDHHITENLGIFGRSSVLFGSRDDDGDLLDGFNSVRSSMGLILSFRHRWLRIWLGTGIEYNHTGAFRATNEFWCKVSGGEVITYDASSGRDCRLAEIAQSESQNLFGPYLMPGVSVELRSPFSLYLNGNFGFYLSSPEVPIDFPLSGEAGIEYAF